MLLGQGTVLRIRTYLFQLCVVNSDLNPPLLDCSAGPESDSNPDPASDPDATYKL
jgi:hypothetical protein